MVQTVKRSGFRFEVDNQSRRNVIKIFRWGHHRPLAIMTLADCAKTGYAMIHLPYLDALVSRHNLWVIWQHLTLHLEKSEYIAYIENRPSVIRLAEYLGFRKENDTWVYRVKELIDDNSNS